MAHVPFSNVNVVGAAARKGAYGFRLTGVRTARAILVDAPVHWPGLKLAVRLDAHSPPRKDLVSDAAATVRLRSGGWVDLDRAKASATFRMPARPTDEALVHPHLAAAAVVAAHWLGRESFHAGAFMNGGGAWAVLGERGEGKSSLLASLALAGVPVVCDDVLVVEQGTVFAGPRSIDLRRDAAGQLGAGEPMGVIGLRERWRLSLPEISPELPLRGWLTLQWADRTELRPIRGGQRLQWLLPHRGIRLPPSDAEALIELSALPMLQLRRPRRWDISGEAVEVLLAGVGG